MRRVGLLVSFIAAQALTLIAVVSPVMNQGWLSGFRNYFSNDQLSYAAIATNVAHGNVALVEPFTLTNSLYYPSLWYQVLGGFSHLTGMPVFTAWNVLGTSAVCTLIAGLGIIAWLMARRVWAPVIPAIALFVGTFATVTSDYWYTSLDHHAVLWGAFGTFFTLNAEAIGLCLNGLAIGLLAFAGFRQGSSPRARPWLLMVSGALIGITANIQTYNFFTGVAIAAFWACAYSLITTRSKPLIIMTVALLALMFVIGRPFADQVGHIPVYGLLLLALAPAVLPLVRHHLKAALAFLIPLALLAAPQVLRTAFGLAEKDPFLTYRQGSTEDLGVPLLHGLLAGLPVLLVVATCIVSFTFSKRPWLTAGLLGGGFAWIILSLNDVWGFSQEPYRLWIQGLILTSLLSFTLLPVALVDGLSAPRARAVFLPLLVVTTIAVAISLLDFPGFWRFAHEQGVMPAADSRADALAQAADAPGALIGAGPCIDPQLVKLVSGARVAFENKGLAWAENRDAIQALMAAHSTNTITPVLLKAAHVGALLTDSACDVSLNFTAGDHIAPEAVFDYTNPDGSFTITRWRVSN
ncbi:MAG: hypothetical protein ACKOAF_00060 [Actinomycetes bacterium]